MFPSYNGGMGTRSRSTADISKTRFGPEVRTTQGIPIGYATMSRATGRNNHRSAVPPSPPTRMRFDNSSSTTNTDSLKRVKSYLTPEMRRDFEQGYQQLSTSAPTNALSPLQTLRQKREEEMRRQREGQSPLPTYGTSNFVKKLVATLERKQPNKTAQKSVMHNVTLRTAEAGEYMDCPPTPPPQPRAPVAYVREELPQVVQVVRKPESQPSFLDRARNNHRHLMPNRFTPNRLSKLHERDDEDLTEDYTTEEEEDSECSMRDSPEDLWCYRSLPASYPAYNPSPIPSTPSPDLINPLYYEIDDDHNEPPASSKQPGSAKRVIKSVISTLKSWRSFKSLKSFSSNSSNDNSPASSSTSSVISTPVNQNLPQGSREYYASRPSLGEEMRAFRSETMPRLYKSAVGRGCDWDRPIPEDQELASVFPQDKINNKQLEQEKKNSIATIRPIYGSTWNQVNKNSALSDNMRPFESVNGQQATSVPENHYMCMTGNRKFVKPPFLPVSPVFGTDLTMRSSRMRDLQKRTSRGESCTSSCSSSSNGSSSVQLRSKNSSSSENLYDVPRMPRPILPKDPPALVNYETIQLQTNKRYSQPEYENFAETIYNDNRRLQTFTTF